MPALLLFLGTVSLVCLSNAAPLDPCVRLSCLNNGTCGSLLHRLASYNCSCPPGLAGLRCQDRVDNCASNPCHHGNCSSSDDGYVCVCEEGYQGDTCDQPLPSTLTPTWAESTLPWQPQPAATSLSSNTTSPLSSPSTSPSSSSSSSLSSSSSPSPSSSSLPKPSYSSSPSPSPSPSPLSLQQTAVTLSPWQPEPGHKIVNLTWDVKEMINSSNFLCADNASNHRVIEVPEETALRIKVNEGDVSVAFWEVTEENFQQCSVSNGKSIIPLHTADGFVLLEEMLSLGNNYFLAIVNDLAAKAMPALRVNVTVKASICIEEKNGLQCSGRGQCITKPSVAAFYCDCEEGHIGLFCEEFDGCSSLQCQNNATCLDVKQGNTERNFTCVCSPGYTGEVCESQIDHCTSQPCEHGATCLSRATGYSCVCPEGFTGLACEQRIDPCALLPCQNNGTCFTDGTSYSCNCSPAYTGPLCTQLIDFCALSPCAHGICRGVGTSYKCLCAPGYHGLYCEEEDDECLSEPCQNSGTCKDLVNGYECLCPDEYEGQHCDLYKDPCTAVSCQNGGTCTSKEQNATCVCVPGFTGERCEADINECDSDPCHHGGTCMNEANGYTCHCPQGWVGIHCDVYLEWKSDRMAESLNNMPRHSLYIIIGALCVAFVLMLIILIVGICRISRIEYQGSSRPSYEEFYNCRSIDSEFSTAIASIRHARFGKKSRPAMYDATPVTYEDYSPDDKPLVTLIKTKDL